MNSNFRSRPRPWARALLVALLVVVAASCSDPRRSRESAGPFPAVEDGENSADRVLFWINIKQFVALTDDDLRRWKEYGVDGFVASTQWLEGMGSGHRFTGDPKVKLDGAPFDLQRSLRDTKIVSRAQSMGMKLYLGFYLANRLNTRTPLTEWFDDAGWRTVALPRIADFAGASKLLGFDGIALDQEMYPQENRVVEATWAVQYPGNTHTAGETRAIAVERGKQVMETMVRAFPGVDLQVYNSMFRDSWWELVQQQINKTPGFQDVLHLDFWTGMTSVEGYDAVRFAESVFYKTPHLSGSTWDTANEYNVNSLFALFSRQFRWTYAASRVHISPFSWIDPGTTAFQRARSPSEVTEQLAAFRTWGTGGEFLNYSQGLTTFDYEPYKDALLNASTPVKVDSETPVLALRAVTRQGEKVDVTGTATDNLGIRAVRWSEDGKPGGQTATMTWTVKSGSYKSELNWEMDWSFDDIDVPAGVTDIVVTVEDIKGLTSDMTVIVPA